MVPEEETDPQSEEEVEIQDHPLLEAGHLLPNDELSTDGHHQEKKGEILAVEIVTGFMTDVTIVIILIEEMIEEEEDLTIEEMIGETNETLFEEATITIDLIATVGKVVLVVVEEIISVTTVEMTDSMTDEEEVTTIEEAVTVVTTGTAKPTDPDFLY